MDRRDEWKYLFDIIRYGLTGERCPAAEEYPD